MFTPDEIFNTNLLSEFKKNISLYPGLTENPRPNFYLMASITNLASVLCFHLNIGLSYGYLMSTNTRFDLSKSCYYHDIGLKVNS